MTSFNDLRDAFNLKVKELQDECPHAKAQWMLCMWAPGHVSSEEALVCLNCNKELSQRPGQLAWDEQGEIVTKK